MEKKQNYGAWKKTTSKGEVLNLLLRTNATQCG